MGQFDPTVRVIRFAPALVLTLAAIISTAPASRGQSATQPAAATRIYGAPAVKVQAFHFQGNTIFTQKDLSGEASKVLAQHPDGILRAEDLERIRVLLTLKYVDAGYINSGAVLPDQSVGPDGVVLYKIIEGRLTNIHVKFSPARAPTTQSLTSTRPASPQPAKQEANYNGQVRPGESPNVPQATKSSTTHFLHESYLTSRVQAAAGPPLNIIDLKNGLELLREDPNVKTINAELRPGDAPGQSLLDMTVAERNPFQLGLRYSNDRSPTVGSYHLDALASDSDLTGNGDDLSARWAIEEGGADSLTFAKDNDYSVNYSLPLTAKDLTLLASYTRTSDLVLEAPFSAADITSHTDDIAATLRQPLVRDPDHELAAFFTISSRYNRTFVLGEPFSLSPGAKNGVSDAFAVRVGPEYSRHDQNEALAIRGTFSAGINGPHATYNTGHTADNDFFDFLGQFQYIRRLPIGRPDDALNDTQLVFRFNTQLTNSPLLNVEQFSLGGVDTVRGYRESELVTDNALFGSVELRAPLYESNGQPILSLIPFVDSGYAWNVMNTPPPELISSAGLGLVFTPNSQIDARIYWGYPFKKFPHTQDDMQDMGFHFSVTVLAL